jgi:transketolase
MLQNSATDLSIIRNLRKKIVQAALNSGEGHIPSALSILDILYCLYVLLPTKIKTELSENDQFILSKGHGSLCLYAVLEEVKLIDSTWVNNFGEFGSDFGGHPDMRKINGVKASTGSLGHGLPISIGKILALRAKKIDCKIYCLVGDGELNEGSNWESILLASNYKMHELTLIIDSNKSGDRALDMSNLQEKLESFGFYVSNVNGHNHHEILSELSAKSDGKPKAIIANTIKGFGFPTMENNPAWHHFAPNIEQFNSLMNEMR